MQNPEIKFILYGKPCCKQSVRKGKYCFYQDKSLISKENIVKQALKEQFKQDIIKNCVIAKITCFFAPKYLQQPKNRHWIGKYYGKIPDHDNISKFYSDCLKRVVVADDKTIVSSTAAKYYGEEYKTTIELTVLDY
jgi:Holliday junction resolvase RusA-like endonuclease